MRSERPVLIGEKVPEGDDQDSGGFGDIPVGLIRVARVDNVAREEEKDNLHYRQIERQSDDVDEHELGILYALSAGVKAPKRPQAVPDESVGDRDGKRNNLRQNPMPIESVSEDLGDCHVQDHARESDDAELHELPNASALEDAFDGFRGGCYQS